MKALRAGAGADRLGDAPVAVDGVDVFDVGHRHAAGVGVAGALAGVGEPYAAAGAGGERHQAGAEEALQVEDEIEAAAAELGGEPGRVSGRGAPPAAGRAAVEGERVGEVGVAGEERFVGGVDYPGDVRRRERPPQRRQHRQGVNHVPQRARLDEGDPFRGHGHPSQKTGFTTESQRARREDTSREKTLVSKPPPSRLSSSSLCSR
jgi:hypothetical protein